jgi:hypothetical protein
VPSFVAVDEHGIVRSTRPSQEGFAADFFERAFDPPAELPPATEPGLQRLASLDGLAQDDLERAPLAAMSALLWGEGASPDDAVACLEADADAHPDDAVRAFRAGVALRMRYDSPQARRGDFQEAIARWTRALELRPNQYVWRRRIQQYGPRFDKPYPFYDWIARARTELGERGETPVSLVAALTPAELASPRREGLAVGAAAAEEPDPKGAIARDRNGLLVVETAVAPATNDRDRVAGVHVAFRPSAAKDAHWNNEVEPMRVWIDADSLPAGWAVDARLLEHPLPDAALSDELRTFSFDVAAPEGASGATLAGYALFYACEGESGTCLYLRKDFAVDVAPGG